MDISLNLGTMAVRRQIGVKTSMAIGMVISLEMDGNTSTNMKNMYKYGYGCTYDCRHGHKVEYADPKRRLHLRWALPRTSRPREEPRAKIAAGGARDLPCAPVLRQDPAKPEVSTRRCLLGGQVGHRSRGCQGSPQSPSMVRSSPLSSAPKACDAKC